MEQGIDNFLRDAALNHDRSPTDVLHEIRILFTIVSPGVQQHSPIKSQLRAIHPFHYLCPTQSILRPPRTSMTNRMAFNIWYHGQQLLQLEITPAHVWMPGVVGGMCASFFRRLIKALNSSGLEVATTRIGTFDDDVSNGGRW